MIIVCLWSGRKQFVLQAMAGTCLDIEMLVQKAASINNEQDTFFITLTRLNSMRLMLSTFLEEGTI